MKNFAIMLLVLFILFAMFLGWYIRGLNHVVRLDEKVNEMWAQVDTQLQRRYDLIPNLVNTVKGYAKHEQRLFTEITKLRSQWARAKTVEEKIEKAQGLENLISRLLLVVENYPDLKASQNFLALQAQLEGTENRIAVARMRYNQAVKDFNAYIRTVFGRFFARRRGLDKPRTYFEARAEARQAPSVIF